MSPEPTRRSYREAKAAYLEHANGYEIGQARDAAGGAAGAEKYAREIAKGLSQLKSSVDGHVEEGLPAERLLQTVQKLEGVLAGIRAAKGRPGPATGAETVDDLFIQAIEELQRHAPGGAG